MRKIPFLSALAILAACSSVPDFRPSKPVEKASSVEEALSVCGEYEISGKMVERAQETASSPRRGAVPSRVSVLTPWIRCFEAVFRGFPEARESESFVAFFRALQARYDGVSSSDAPVIDWPEMNFAVRSTLPRLFAAGEPKSFSREERHAIERQLPGYGTFLAETGRFGGRARRSRYQTGNAGSLSPLSKDDVAIRGRADGFEKAPPRALRLSEAQRGYCRKFRQYKALRQSERDLADYKRILDGQTYADVSNDNERAMRRRVSERHEKTKQEADALERAIEAEGVVLRAKSAWFRDGHCVE